MSVYGWTTANQRLPVISARPKLVDNTVVAAPTSLSVSDASVPYIGAISRSRTVFTWDSSDALGVNYVVQLNGMDYGITMTPRFEFYNLVPGIYTFGVIALNAAGVKSDVATISHNVTTPSGIVPAGVNLVLHDMTPGQPSKQLALLDGELVTVEV